jgi:hypothetical protein
VDVVLQTGGGVVPVVLQTGGGVEVVLQTGGGVDVVLQTGGGVVPVVLQTGGGVLVVLQTGGGVVPVVLHVGGGVVPVVLQVVFDPVPGADPVPVVLLDDPATNPEVPFNELAPGVMVLTPLTLAPERLIAPPAIELVFPAETEEDPASKAMLVNDEEFPGVADAPDPAPA